MANYRQMYLDLLSEHNPKELKRLKASGKLESVLNRVREEAAAEEGRLVREIAESDLLRLLPAALPLLAALDDLGV